MSVKAIEMVRKIRDKHYKETKGFSFHDQSRFIKEKSNALRKELKKSQRSKADTINAAAPK
jgi:deoxyadenosine/deoxycytidine kinase